MELEIDLDNVIDLSAEEIKQLYKRLIKAEAKVRALTIRVVALQQQMPGEYADPGVAQLPENPSD